MVLKLEFMSVIACSDTFSIPFRRKNKAFGWIPYFVGDRANRALRILSQPDFRCCIEWPLLLYGATGTGKTELANSVLLEHARPAERPVMWTGTDFVRAYLSAVDTDSLRDLRIKLYQSGGLLVDDIESLEDHPACQVELTHLIDQLRLREVPLVVTAKNSPDQLIRLLPQLGSRLMQGLVLPVHPPGDTARRMIIDYLCRASGLLLTDEARSFLVRQLPVGLPRLRQVINQIAALVPDTGDRQLDTSSINRLLVQVSSNETSDPAAVILELVASQFNVTPKQLCGKSRKQTVACARSVAVYLLRNLLEMGYAEIGQQLGGRDHSTIMYSNRKIRSILNDDPKNPLAISTLKLEARIRDALIVH